jgi:hypothetical protein
MSASPQIRKAVEQVIREKISRKERITKSNIVTTVFSSRSHRGDYSSFGISRADLMMAVRDIIADEVTRQFKSKMPDSFHRAAMAKCPPALVQTMAYLPQLIAIEQGPNAEWVPTINATADHWLAHARMKHHISDMTELKAQTAEDIERYLRTSGFTSLGKAFGIT